MPTGAPARTRHSGVELLRIVCMLQIIFLHVADHGGYTHAAGQIGGEKGLIMWLLVFLCRCPVYVFLLITGYYSAQSQSFHSGRRLAKTYAPMLFYALAIPAVVALTGAGEVTGTDWIKGFFPVLSRTWYFMSLYFLVVLLAPFLNRMTAALTKRQFLLLLGILFFMLCLWQPAAKIEPINEVIGIKKVFNTDTGKSLYDFVFMYLLGSYLRLHPLRPVPHLRLACVLTYGACTAFNVALLYALPQQNIGSVLKYNDNPLVVVQCVCLFLLFHSFTFHNKFVNAVAACSGGVYMIHEHPLVRTLLWKSWFDLSHASFYRGHGRYLVYIAAIVVCIYVLCVAIDWLRGRGFQLVGKGLARLRKPAPAGQKE